MAQCFETRERGGGWGHIVHQAKRIALLQFPKMSFALFVGTSNLCEICFPMKVAEAHTHSNGGKCVATGS